MPAARRSREAPAEARAAPASAGRSAGREWGAEGTGVAAQLALGKFDREDSGSESDWSIPGHTAAPKTRALPAAAQSRSGNDGVPRKTNRDDSSSESSGSPSARRAAPKARALPAAAQNRSGNHDGAGKRTVPAREGVLKKKLDREDSGSESDWSIPGQTAAPKTRALPAAAQSRSGNHDGAGKRAAPAGEGALQRSDESGSDSDW